MSFAFIKENNGATLQPDYTQVVVVAALWKEQILLVHREAQPFKGLYSIPGGHVEQGETYESAARRELAEETRIKADTLTPLVVVLDHKRRLECHSFLFLSDDGTFSNPDNEEQEVIGWKTFSAATRLPLSPGLYELFGYMESRQTE